MALQISYAAEMPCRKNVNRWAGRLFQVDMSVCDNLKSFLKLDEMYIHHSHLDHTTAQRKCHSPWLCWHSHSYALDWSLHELFAVGLCFGSSLACCRRYGRRSQSQTPAGMRAGRSLLFPLAPPAALTPACCLPLGSAPSQRCVVLVATVSCSVCVLFQVSPSIQLLVAPAI